MIHAIKTSLGSYKNVDGDGTHVIMTSEEYHDYVKISRMLRDDIRRFSRESVDLHSKLQDDIKTIDSLRSQLSVSEEKIKELSRQKDELEQSITTLREEITKLTDDLAYAESLNVNLKRICRERANQARGLSKTRTDTLFFIAENIGRNLNVEN